MHEELTSRKFSANEGQGSSDSTSEYIDRVAVIENDGRSKTVTGFDSSNPQDSAGNSVDNPVISRNGKVYRKWEYLNQLNDGIYESDRASQNWRVEKLNDADLFASHLDFTDREEQELKEIVEEMNFNQFGSYSTEEVMVALCSLISDKHTSDFDNRIILDDKFKELMTANNMGSREHRRVRQLIREKTDFF